MLEMKTATV